MMTVEEYLALERSSETRHEYIDGYVYAMAGGTNGHGVISANVIAALSPYLGDGPCRAYTSDVKVRLSPTRYVYPDVAVSCDERDNADDNEDEVHYPCLVVEVLSRTTEEYDRTDKFDLYAGCAALRDYVLVNARRQSVHVYSRDDGAWTVRLYGPGTEISLPSLDVQVPIAAIYRAVRLPAGPAIGPV
jgi:Uma2 family endonuclease